MVAETLSNCQPPPFGISGEWLASVLPNPGSEPVLNSLLNLLTRCLADSLTDRLSDVRELQRDLIPLLRDCPAISQAKAARAGAIGATTLQQTRWLL